MELLTMSSTPKAISTSSRATQTMETKVSSSPLMMRLKNRGSTARTHSTTPTVSRLVCTGRNFSCRSRTMPSTPYRVSMGSCSRYSKREARWPQMMNRATAEAIISSITTRPMPAAWASLRAIMPRS